MKLLAPKLVLLLLLAGAFALATSLQGRALSWTNRAKANGLLNILFGDGRRLFANHFFIKADVSLHSGYYPSIFDQRQAPKENALAGGEDSHHEHQDKFGVPASAGSHLAGGEDSYHEHEEEMDFLGKPKDWIERFGRHFEVTKHTHLEGGQEREILPWLRVSAELDPQRVETYTVAAYWLRRHLGKVDEAEQFLREGLRANPASYEILFELGLLNYESRHDAGRARNLWELALRRWREQEPGKKEPDNRVLEQITVNLARLEEEQGNFARVIDYLEQAKKVSPAPEALQERIEEIKKKHKGQ